MTDRRTAWRTVKNTTSIGDNAAERRLVEENHRTVFRFPRLTLEKRQGPLHPRLARPPAAPNPAARVRCGGGGGASGPGGTAGQRRGREGSQSVPRAAARGALPGPREGAVLPEGQPGDLGTRQRRRTRAPSRGSPGGSARLLVRMRGPRSAAWPPAFRRPPRPSCAVPGARVCQVQVIAAKSRRGPRAAGKQGWILRSVGVA